MQELYDQKQDGRRDNLSFWRCGQQRKRSEVVANFAKSSSVHGAAYVFSSSERGVSKCGKFGYRVLFVFCVLCVILHIAYLIQDNFINDSTYIHTINRDRASGYEGDPHFPIYPRITICRRPFYRTDMNSTYLQLVEYAMLSLGGPFIPLTPTEVASLLQLVFDDLGIFEEDLNSTAIDLEFDNLGIFEELSSTAIDLRERLSNLEKKYRRLKVSEEFNLRSFIKENSVNCSELFSSCALSLPVDCCKLFSPVLTTDGWCFALDDRFFFNKVLQSLLTATSSLNIDLITPTASEGREVGFRVYFSDPSIETSIRLEQFEGRNIMPGSVTTITASLIKTDRVNLHTPWHGMWFACPTWGRTDNESSDRYSYDVCEQDNYFGWLGRVCGCEPVLHIAGSHTSRLCDPIDMYQCSVRASVTNPSDFLDKLAGCRQPCTIYSYKTEISYMGMGGGSNISRVEIMYNSDHYTLNEYRKATLPFLFSQIGGSLGLCLGASIITLVEIVGFVASWLWYRLVPAKVAKVKPQFYKGRLQGDIKKQNL